MKRIKSAPANIAEMVNRKKPSLEKKPEKIVVFISHRNVGTLLFLWHAWRVGHIYGESVKFN